MADHPRSGSWASADTGTLTLLLPPHQRSPGGRLHFPSHQRAGKPCVAVRAPEVFALSKLPPFLEPRNLGCFHRDSAHRGSLRRVCWVCLFTPGLAFSCLRQLIHGARKKHTSKREHFFQGALAFETACLFWPGWQRWFDHGSAPVAHRKLMCVGCVLVLQGSSSSSALAALGGSFSPVSTWQTSPPLTTRLGSSADHLSGSAREMSVGNITRA